MEERDITGQQRLAERFEEHAPPRPEVLGAQLDRLHEGAGVAYALASDDDAVTITNNAAAQLWWPGEI